MSTLRQTTAAQVIRKILYGFIYISLISTLYITQNLLHYINFMVHHIIFQLDFMCFNFRILFVLIILDTLCIVIF